MKKTFKSMITTIITAISGFLFFSCNQAENLKGTWNISGLEKDGIAQEIVISNIVFTTEGNNLIASGESGVNLFSGSVVAGKKKIRFVNVGCTRMMGEPKAMEYEDIFLEVINYADSYSIENDILTINASKKNLKLQFKKAN